MPSDRPATTIRLTDEDRTILDRLRKITGLASATAIIRMAIREALAARDRRPKR
jgi:predicted DNA-binding protein